MKIHQILNGIGIIVTNEERDFIKKHGEDVPLSLLDPHQHYLAHTLVRKGVYEMSDDRRSITKKNKTHE
jgi:hypothetical protein